MKHWCVRHNQACDYANSGGDCNVSACQTVIGGDRKMTNREWLEAQGFEPVSAYGKYVLVTVGGELKDYKDFTEAAEAQGWKYERN